MTDSFVKDVDYRKILVTMFDDLVIVDKNGQVIYVSEGFEKNYNVSQKIVIGKSIDELEKRHIFTPSVAKKVFETKENVIMSHKNKRGNYVIVKGIPIFDDLNCIKYVVSYSVGSDDIQMLQNERVPLLEKLEEYQEALGSLKRDFDTMKRTLSDAVESKRAIQYIDKIKEYDVSVLFVGESGVGKTTYARHLHNNGTRAKGAFVEISCGAIPENLLESELFGYAKGSFTGAKDDGKIGLIETANHGTLFLDEIAELPLKLQVKLLKVLQNKTIMRIGDTKEIEVDFRLIAATNKDLFKMVEEGTFREDLFYRINVITIELPPLRKRQEDILSFIQYFLVKFNLKYGEKKRITRDCMRALCNYSWPGNIRELENVVEQLVILSSQGEIVVDDLPEALRKNIKLNDADIDMDEKKYRELISEHDKLIFEEAVKKYKTSVEVAKKLGISQSTAARKIRKYLDK